MSTQGAAGARSIAGFRSRLELVLTPWARVRRLPRVSCSRPRSSQTSDRWLIFPLALEIRLARTRKAGPTLPQDGSGSLRTPSADNADDFQRSNVDEGLLRSLLDSTHCAKSNAG
jgi:hypothetical protein